MREALEEIGGFRISIDDFRGINLFDDVIKTGDEEASRMENFVLSKSGNAKSLSKRTGITRYNTNSPASSSSIKSVYEYIAKSKTSNFTRLIVKTNNRLAYCEGTGAFTDILSGLQDGKMRFVTFEDNCVAVNNNAGADKNYVYDGTTIAELGIIPTPQIFKLTESTGSGSGLPNGEYAYIITYLYNGDQESFPIMQTLDKYPDEDSNSNGSGGFIGYPKIELNFRKITTASAKPVIVSAIPTGNGRVTARKIYRTKKNATTYYYHSTINDNTTTTFIDTKADTELTEEIGLDYIFKPMYAKRACVHKGSLWLGNLKENMYGTAPSESGVSITGSAGTGSLTTDGSPTAREAYYTYKFAKIYIITQFNTAFGKPYTGYIGKKSTGIRQKLNNGHNTAAITGIDNTDSWTGRVAIWRNTCQFITGISVSGTELTVTVGVGEAFKDGETVAISGVLGFSSNPNGSYVIRECDYSANTFKITHTTGGGSYTANTGVAEGGNFYYAGVTPIIGSTNAGKFTDTIGDTDLVLYDGILKDFLVKERDDTFSSGVMHSVPGKGDIFQTAGINSVDNFIDVFPNDNCELKEISEIFGGVLILKENGPCVISTQANSSADWIPKKLDITIGATDDDNVNSFVKLNNNEYVYMSNKIFYHVINGNAINCSKNIQSELDGLTMTNLDGVYDEVNRVVIFTYSTASADGKRIYYDLTSRNQSGIGEWYFDTGGSYDLRLRSPIITKAGLLLFGSSIPYLYKNGTGYQDSVWNSDTLTFNNQDISAVWQSKTFDADSLLLRRIHGKAYSTSGGNITIYWMDNSGSETNKTVTLASGNTRFNFGVNSRAKRQRIRIVCGLNMAFTLQEVCLDFKNLHRAGGRK